MHGEGNKLKNTEFEMHVKKFRKNEEIWN